MLSMLEKFEMVEVKSVDKISVEDRMYCEGQEKIYKHLLRTYENFREQLEPIFQESEEFSMQHLGKKDPYVTATMSSYKISDIDKTIEQMKNKLISAICYYFMKKYNVTINIDKIEAKYKNDYFNITYLTIIDEIMEQLGGFTFTEKADNELKDKMKKHTMGSALKKNKIVIDKFFHLDYFDLRWGNTNVNYSCDERFKDLLTAVTYFETDIIENKYTELYRIITQEKNENLIKVHDIEGNKVTSLKLFKNGKIELTFVNSQFAEEFYKQFCN